jgi:hypothetical protein
VKFSLSLDGVVFTCSRNNNNNNNTYIKVLKIVVEFFIVKLLVKYFKTSMYTAGI